MPIGRGGSGNIWEAQREKEVIAEDVEAQLADQQKQIAEAQAKASSPAEYAHGGRGGAGNWYSPRELAATGKFESVKVTPQPSTTTSQAAPIRVGRGGAGNFSYAAEQSAKDVQNQEAEQAEKMQKIQAAVAQSIDDQLAAPAKARVPSERIE